jgi:hypothetical protein
MLQRAQETRVEKWVFDTGAPPFGDCRQTRARKGHISPTGPPPSSSIHSTWHTVSLAGERSLHIGCGMTSQPRECLEGVRSLGHPQGSARPRAAGEHVITSVARQERAAGRMIEERSVKERIGRVKKSVALQHARRDRSYEVEVVAGSDARPFGQLERSHHRLLQL